MKHTATRELFAYWDRLRGERLAPDRREIEPAAIRGILADTFMLDVDIAQGFPFRLAGTRVNALFETDQKGSPFLQPWREEERRNIAAVLMAVADGVCPVVAGAVAAPQGQGETAFELLFLPLRHFGKTHCRILGLVKPLAAPTWLGLLPVGPLTLRSLRIIDDVRNTMPVPERLAVGQDPMRAPDLPRNGSLLMADGVVKPSRPYLRVIEGGR